MARSFRRKLLALRRGVQPVMAQKAQRVGGMVHRDIAIDVLAEKNIAPFKHPRLALS